MIATIRFSISLDGFGSFGIDLVCSIQMIKTIISLWKSMMIF